MQTRLKKIIVGLNFTCSALLITGCVNHKNDDKVSEDIVLKIGKVAISEYEVKLNYDLAKQSNSSGKINYEQWLVSFLDKVYFLADAFEKRYDTIPEISKVVNYAAQEMMGCVDGYLWNKEVAPTIEIKNAELKEAYKKRDKVFYIEYVKFDTKEEYTYTLNNDTSIKDVAKFNKTISIIKNQKKQIYNNQGFLYPFDDLSLFKESIYDMHDDQVNTFYTPSGIYVLRVIKIEPIKQPPFRKEKDNIKEVLTKIKKIEIAQKKQVEIFKQANIEINQKILPAILEKNNARDSILSKLNPTLMTYFLSGEKVTFKINDFYDYYENAPFINTEIRKETLINTLKNYVLEKYLFIEAEKLGVTKDKKYLFDKNNYLNRSIRMYYENEEFRKHVNLTNDDLENYYMQHKTDYSESKTSYITVFTFKDINNAYNNWDFIKYKIAQNDFKSLSDTSIIKGLLSYAPNIKIDRRNVDFPSQIISAVLSNNVNIVLTPMEFNGKGLIIYKTKEEGKTVKPFEDVRAAINEQLYTEKIEQLKNARLKEVKYKYKVEINKIKTDLIKI
jgi:hypothetical protein